MNDSESLSNNNGSSASISASLTTTTHSNVMLIENSHAEIDAATTAIDRAQALASNFTEADKSPNALLRAIECYTLALSIAKALPPTHDNKNKIIQEIQTKIIKTIKRDFIYEGLGISSTNMQAGYFESAFSGFQNRLQDIRTQFNHHGLPVAEYHQKISKALSDLFKDICEFCAEMVGLTGMEQKKGMALVSLGSFATQLAMPYSDAEYIVLLSEERQRDNRAKHSAIAALIEVMVTALGETPPHYARASIEQRNLQDYIHYIPKGFRVDEAKKPRAENWQISLVNSIAHFTGVEALKSFQPGNHLSAALLLPGFLTGDKTLFQAYQASLCAKIKSGFYDEIIRQFIKHNLREQKTLVSNIRLQVRNNDLGHMQNLKNLPLFSINLAFELSFLLYRQSKCEQPPQTVWQALDIIKLAIDPNCYAYWRTLIETILKTRCELSLINQQHTADMSLKDLQAKLSIQDWENDFLAKITQITEQAEQLEDLIFNEIHQNSSSGSAVASSGTIKQWPQSLTSSNQVNQVGFADIFAPNP